MSSERYDGCLMIGDGLWLKIDGPDIDVRQGAMDDASLDKRQRLKMKRHVAR